MDTCANVSPEDDDRPIMLPPTGKKSAPSVEGVDRPTVSGLSALGDARYKALINSLDEGFCIIEMIFDSQGRPADYLFLETNPAFELHSGLVDAVGKRMREMVPDHDEHWFELFGSVATTGISARYENYALGLRRWFNAYAFRCDGAGSRIVAVLFNDITERKKAEERIALLTRLSESLASVSNESDIVSVALEAVGTYLNVDRCYFVEYEESAHILHVSRNWLRGDSSNLEGRYVPTDFGGDAWWEKYSGGNITVDDVATDPLTVEHAQRYLDLGIHSYAMKAFRRAGSPMVSLGVTEKLPRQWTVADLRFMDDAMARVWPMVERARTERALRETLEQRVAERTAKLQETIAELETFSYSISHDLRAPLRAMQGFAGVLEEEHGDKLDSKARDHLRRIIRAGERMDRLIQDVLVFSRVARAETPLERVELEGFLAGILESYPQFGDDHARIETVLPLATVLANPAALTQCVSNLVSNGIKFVAPRTRPHIRLWTERVARGWVRLYVGDNGIGLAADRKDSIFGIFYQVDQSRGGTGIGLAVVRKAVERMGGSVGVESTPGKGSTFWLELEEAPRT